MSTDTLAGNDGHETLAAPAVAETLAAGAPAADLVPGLAVIGAVIDDKDWKKVLIVAGGNIPSGEKRVVIVVEHASEPTFHEDGSLDKGRETKLQGYPTKADLYVRITPEVEFSGDAPVVTVGVDVDQVGVWGLTPDPRHIHVGPGSPTYVAINLAFQRGAQEVEVIGLSKRDTERLKPFVDRIPTYEPWSAPDLVVKLPA